MEGKLGEGCLRRIRVQKMDPQITIKIELTEFFTTGSLPENMKFPDDFGKPHIQEAKYWQNI